MLLYDCDSNNDRIIKSMAVVSIVFLQSVVAQTNNCSPTSCSTICNPTCSSNQKCILKTMTECGVCPQAICISTGTAGIPTETSSTPSSGSSNDTGPIVGGIVGGLVGLGIIIGIATYCYFKRNKKLSAKLPFAFMNNASRGVIAQQQEKPTTTTPPHPAVVAALAHQNDRLSTLYSNNRQSVHSLHDMNSEDEFEKRIALQNKRISEILMANPRLSYNTANNESRRISSTTYYTTEEESDMDDTKSVSTVDSGAVVRTVSPQSSVAVVQVVRAKPQIMRVNSVRSSFHNNGSGLSRNDSVRTVLTPQQPQVKEEDEEEDEQLPEFPTTPNNLSFVVEQENPFNDIHSTPTTTTK